MGKELKQVGKSGVMINKDWKRGENPAFDKVLSDILNNRLKVKNEKPEKKKKKKKKTKLKKIKDVKTT